MLEYAVARSSVGYLQLFPSIKSTSEGKPAEFYAQIEARGRS